MNITKTLLGLVSVLAGCAGPSSVCRIGGRRAGVMSIRRELPDEKPFVDILRVNGRVIIVSRDHRQEKK